MSERSFFQAEAKASVRAAIEAVESQTSAEVVVAVRRWSGDYRGADLLFGSILAFGSLVVLLFSPLEFPIASMPFDVAIAYAAGVIASTYLWGLRRALTLPSRLRDNVRTAARAAFVDMGITRTKDRNGLLVYVSMLERRVDVVADVGIDVEALGAPYQEAVAAMEASVRRGADLERFLAAVTSLGPVLGAAMPRSADDVNELSDEVDAA